MGRFLQEDPLGFGAGDANFYRYVDSNPVNFKDPRGLTSCNRSFACAKPFDPIGGGGGGAGATIGAGLGATLGDMLGDALSGALDFCKKLSDKLFSESEKGEEDKTPDYGEELLDKLEEHEKQVEDSKAETLDDGGQAERDIAAEQRAKDSQKRNPQPNSPSGVLLEFLRGLIGPMTDGDG